jgi:hypothetical protein
MRLLIASIVLFLLFQNAICDGKYPGFYETEVGPFDIYYLSRGDKTDFYVTVPLGPSGLTESNGWIAVGFNSQKEMNKATDVICKVCANFFNTPK